MPFLVLFPIMLFSGCSEEVPGNDVTVTVAEPAVFVGSEQCGSCHAEQYRLWTGSHHQLAMQQPSEASVLGDFERATFDYYDSRYLFSNSGNGFSIRTTDVPGSEQDFPVAYTFGVAPLQQYLVHGERGRLQALTLSWDSRSAGAGGQRWYHLYPDERVTPGDSLHWTGPLFTWNVMCAECHSTGIEVNYDFETDSFDTRYREISVGCEGCHGPGSRHTEQASEAAFDAAFGLAVDLDDRRDGSWVMNPQTGIAELSSPGARQQPESCGRCHARRATLSGNYEYGLPLTQTHMPALLDEGLYHADGRILDEVYVYGSFLQSRMYAAGVTCSDCHEPHSGNLHTGPDPNSACATCHLPARFATAEHSPTGVGDCVSCHMPARTYMGVDDRRDHSFRIPDAGSAPGHYGPAIAAGRRGAANATLVDALANPEYPGIVRGTLLSLIDGSAAGSESAGFEAVAAHRQDPDPLVRIGALRALRSFPASVRGILGSELLGDPVRAVRVEAAVTFLDQRDLLPVDDARAFGVAIDEYRESLELSAALPEAALRLAELESGLGNPAVAGRYYRRVLEIDPNHAAGHHAYGLYLVRQGRRAESLAHFERAAESQPGNPRYAYVLGVALNSLGQPARAIETLTAARSDFPADFDIGFALATVLRDDGDTLAALRVAEELLEYYPENSQLRQLVASLR